MSQAITTSADQGFVIPEFARALAAVDHVTKTNVADTGKYKYSYADLGDVLDEVKRVLSMFGLAITQVPTAVEGAGGAWMLALGATLFHVESGEWMEFPPLMTKLPPDPQAFGSALTYARRYQLLTIFGIAPEDDDGKAATDQARRQQEDGNRTEAEARIRRILGEMSAAKRTVVVAAFKERFGVGLSDLAASKHGEALTFVIDTIGQMDEARSAEIAELAAEAETTQVER